MPADDRRGDKPQRASPSRAASRLAALSWTAASLLRIRRPRLQGTLPGRAASRLAALSVLALDRFRAWRRAARTLRLRDVRRDVGVCPDCGGAPEPGRVRCADCLAAAADAVRDLRTARRERGLCWRCGSPSGVFRTCESCRKSERSRDAARRETRRDRASRIAFVVALARQRDRLRKW